MSDEREARLAGMVLDLEGLKGERRALAKEMGVKIAELQEQIEALARDIRSGQLTIESGPEMKLVGWKRSGK